MTAPGARGRPADAFPATSHSALAAIRGTDPQRRRRALDSLAAAYWRPVYTYLRLRWRKSHDEAADLTQEFFAHLLAKDLLDRFDPDRARLRTFLRLSIDGIAANRARSDHRRMYAGGSHGRVDPEGGSLPLDLSTTESPDILFEREWRRALLGAAVARLEERCAQSGKQEHFSLLEEYDLASGGPRPSYAELARRNGIAVTDVTNRLSWARQKLRECVRELLRETTATDSEYREDARALLGLDES
jgi:RNA polymerase sigma-70 factor (ECF subfamily)